MERVAFAKARAAKQREYLTSVRRKFFKSVRPQVERELAAAAAQRPGIDGGAGRGDGGGGDPAPRAQPPPVLAPPGKRRRDSDADDDGSAGEGGGKRQRVDPRSLPADLARDKKKAKRMARLLAQPNRFTPALKQAVSAAEERDRQRAEAERQRAEADRRAADRRRVAKQYAQRTRTGQPVMAHRAKDLLRRVERAVGGPSGGGGR